MTEHAPLTGMGYKWVILAMNFLVLAVAQAALSTWSVEVPLLQETFHVSSVSVQLGASALIAGWAIGSFVQAELAARIGFKRAGMVALIFLIAPQFLIPWIRDFNVILILRFLQGWGMIWMITIGLATTWFPVAQRGMAAGLVTAAVPFGVGAGGIAVGALVALVQSWQATFTYVGIVTAVIGIGWAVLAQDAPNSRSEVLLKRSPKVSPYGLAVGWLVAGSNFCNAFQLLGLFAILPAYLYHLGYSPIAAGNALLVAGASGVVSSPIGGLVSDAWIRHGGRPLQSRAYVMALLGFLVAAVGTFLLPFAGMVGYVAILAAIAVATWNAGAALIGTLPAEMVGDPAVAGRLLGLIILVGLPGGAISPYVSAALGSRAGWTAAFGLLGTVALCGVVLGLIAPRFANNLAASRSDKGSFI